MSRLSIDLIAVCIVLNLFAHQIKEEEKKSRRKKRRKPNIIDN